MSRITSLRTLLLATNLLAFGAMSGQDVIKDFETRAGLAYGTDLTKKWDVNVSQEFRIADNSTRLRKSLTTVGMDYKILDFLRVGANYRLLFNEKGDQTYGLRHRFMGDIVFKSDLRRFTLSYRMRYQREVRTANYSGDVRNLPYTDLRNTVKVNYTINRVFRPYLSYDSRFLLQEPGRSEAPFQDRYRLVAGLDVFLSRTETLGIYFMYARETNVSYPTARYILGVEFGFGSVQRLLGT